MPFGWINRNVVLSLLSLGAVCVFGILGLMRYEENLSRIVFLDVGQGDAILIQEGRRQILIDGGRNGQVLLNALGRELPFFDRTIEVVIATHADADHIGGLPELFGRYRIGQFIETGVVRDSTDFQLLRESLERAQVPHEIFGTAGTFFALPHGGKLTIIYPETLPLDPTLDSNEGSIVARYDFGETSFLLTGDLPHEEQFLPNIKPVDVLKVAHHGSKYSTSDTWLNLVQPREAVLSVGKNTYGHPSQEVVDRLSQRNIAIRRTDREGTIRYRCLVGYKACYRENEGSMEDGP